MDTDLRDLFPDELARISHALQTVVLSTREERCQAALDARAAAFVCKSESPVQVLSVLQAISVDAGQ